MSPVLKDTAFAGTLHIMAEVMEVGDVGVYCEFCLVPDLHNLADVSEAEL